MEKDSNPQENLQRTELLFQSMYVTGKISLISLHVLQLSKDGSLYLHFEACGDGPVLAVDFGQGGEVIACCECLGLWPGGRSCLA